MSPTGGISPPRRVRHPCTGNSNLRTKRSVNDPTFSLANRSGTVDVAEAQAKLTQALAQLQALERLRKNVNAPT